MESSLTSTLSSSEGYFSATSSSTSSPVSTPSIYSGEQIKSIPVLDRDIPKPAQEIDVAEALKRTPGRWTIQGQMNANRQRGAMLATITRETEEAPRTSLEKAKLELLASHKGLTARFGKQ